MPPMPSRPRVCRDRKDVAWMMTFLEQTGAAALIPEMFLAIAAMALLMLGVFRRRAHRDRRHSYTCGGRGSGHLDAGGATGSIWRRIHRRYLRARHEGAGAV